MVVLMLLLLFIGIGNTGSTGSDDVYADKLII